MSEVPPDSDKSVPESSNRIDRRIEQFRKLFIGGLHLAAVESDIKTHFTQWGEVVDVIIVKDRGSGRSKGFGFITFKDEMSVDSTQASRPHIIKGKEVETRRPMPKEDSHREENQIKTKKLYVAGLKPELTESQLSDYFSKFGEVTVVEIVRRKDTGVSKGVGFVSFSDYDPVDKCVLYKPHFLCDSRCDCKRAISKSQLDHFHFRHLNNKNKTAAASSDSQSKLNYNNNTFPPKPTTTGSFKVGSSVFGGGVVSQKQDLGYDPTLGFASSEPASNFQNIDYSMYNNFI